MNRILHLKIKGMHCVGCAAQLEQALSSVEGVRKTQINFVNEKATVEILPAPAHLEQDVLETIKQQGYDAENFTPHLPIQDHHHISGKSTVKTDLLLAIGFSLPLFAHMMGIAVPPYIQLLCATIVQFWAGRQFYKAAWFSLKNMMGNMDLLVTLGTTAAYVYSLAAVLLHKPDLYFESGAIVITLVLLGRFLEDRAKRSANMAVRSLMALSPPTALVKRKGQYVTLSTEEIRKNDHILVKAWQRIPVDGIILQGTSEIDESMVTGESIPVFKEPGDGVIGGTMNTSGSLDIKATTLGAKSTLSRMIHLIEQAQSSHPPIQKLVDRISAAFVPAVLLISLLTFFVWLGLGFGFQHSLLVSISVLVIACPCALGLATPTAIVVAMGVGAKRGLLIKDLESLEALRKVDQVVFDKTGTLTRGEFSLTFSETLSALPEKKALGLAVALQRRSEHPLAKAFLRAFKGKTYFSVKDFVSIPGRGVQGVIKDTVYYLGSDKFMAEHNIDVPRSLKTNKTVVYLGTTGSLLALFHLADLPRKKAFETLKTLHSMGLKTVMLTGDDKETAQAIGNKVGVDEIHAQLAPKDKLNYVKAQEYHHEHIAMIGDGVNDAPALAAATVGFALGSGTDVAMETAPIVLMRPSLELIPQAFSLSKKTFHIIQENLFWAFIFNVVGIGLAAFGKLSPEIAGAAMAASSLIVVLNSLRLKYV